MGEVNQVLKEERIEYNGTEYALHRPTFDVEQFYETWLEKRALKKIMRDRADLGEDNFQKALKGHYATCAAGEYAWGSAAMNQAHLNPPGFKHLMFLLF